MAALDWLRSKAQVSQSYRLENDDKTQAWDVTMKRFRGVLPYRMRRELQKAPLIKTESEHEVIRFEHTPSGHATGYVEFFHTIYAEVAA